MIQTVCVIGANGTMGSQIAALITALGNTKTFLVSRTFQKSKRAVEAGLETVRSDSFKKNMIPVSYAKLENAVRSADLIIESVAEDVIIKRHIHQSLSKLVSQRQIITTTTSAISIEDLSSQYTEVQRKRFFGIHFFNPPYKMPLCELIPTKSSDRQMAVRLQNYLESHILRKVIRSRDTPGFIANRIGFHTLHLATLHRAVAKTNGIHRLNSLLSRQIGRSMGPFQTIDLVGHTVYEAIIAYLSDNLPDEKRFYTSSKYIRRARQLSEPLKTFYAHETTGDVRRKVVYDISSRGYRTAERYQSAVLATMSNLIHVGEYRKAFSFLAESTHPDAEIIKHFLVQYVNYAFSQIGVSAESIRDIDYAMAYGFNWLPPSGTLMLLGGKSWLDRYAREHSLSITQNLTRYQSVKEISNNEIDYRSFIKA